MILWAIIFQKAPPTVANFKMQLNMIKKNQVDKRPL